MGWTLINKILYFLYKLLASWLPHHSNFARSWRRFWLKRIVEYCGVNVNVEKFASFTPKLRIGNNSGIGINCEMNGPVTIGDDVMMGPEVVVYTTRHEDKRTDIPMRLQGMKDILPVTIGNDVWIGRRVVILPGVTIGEGCIIGACSVVTKDIPPYSVAVGTPAKVIRKRKEL